MSKSSKRGGGSSSASRKPAAAAPAAATSGGPRRRWVAVASGFVVLAVLGAGIFVVTRTGSSGTSSASSTPKTDRTGSVEIPTKGTLGIHHPLDAYRVVYRIDDYAGGDHVVTTDELSVRRPFESRLDSKSGPPPGEKPAGSTVSGFATFSSVAADPSTTPLVTTTSPGIPGSDLRLDVSLADLVRSGTVQLREHRRVLDTECQVVRTGEPIGTGRLAPPTATDYADDCIDDRGIVLEEVWSYTGKIVRRRVATLVDDHPTFTASTFDAGGKAVPLAQGGGQLIKITPTSRPAAAFWELPKPPAGFTKKGRYLVLTTKATGGSLPAPVQTVDDVYVNGRDTVIIEQGDQNGHEGVFSADGNVTKVTAGALPDPELVVGVYGNVVRSKLDSVRYLRVLGTLPPQQLVDIATALAPQPRGEITADPTP